MLFRSHLSLSLSLPLSLSLSHSLSHSPSLLLSHSSSLSHSHSTSLPLSLPVITSLQTDMGPFGKYLFEWRAFGEVILNKCETALTVNSVGLQVSRERNVISFFFFCFVNHFSFYFIMLYKSIFSA